MKMDLKKYKKIYDSIGNNNARVLLLKFLELSKIRKDILRIDTNDLCNIFCIMCYTHLNKGKSMHFLPVEDFTRILDLFGKSVRFLYVACNFEPLLTPNFTNYLTCAKSRGIPFISFPTNALLLKKEISEYLVDNSINEIIISLNGYETDDYNRIMFRSDFNNILKNLDYLVEYKKKNGTKFPKIRINTLLIKSNLRNLDKLVWLIKKYDISAVDFRELLVIEGQNNPDEVKKEMISKMAMCVFVHTIKRRW